MHRVPRLTNTEGSPEGIGEWGRWAGQLIEPPAARRDEKRGRMNEVGRIALRVLTTNGPYSVGSKAPEDTAPLLAGVAGSNKHRGEYSSWARTAKKSRRTGPCQDYTASASGTAGQMFQRSLIWTSTRPTGDTQRFRIAKRQMGHAERAGAPGSGRAAADVCASTHATHEPTRGEDYTGTEKDPFSLKHRSPFTPLTPSVRHRPVAPVRGTKKLDSSSQVSRSTHPPESCGSPMGRLCSAAGPS